MISEIEAGFIWRFRGRGERGYKKRATNSRGCDFCKGGKSSRTHPRRKIQEYESTHLKSGDASYIW